jgi:hypothetical protein
LEKSELEWFAEVVWPCPSLFARFKQFRFDLVSRRNDATDYEYIFRSALTNHLDAFKAKHKNHPVFPRVQAMTDQYMVEILRSKQYYEQYRPNIPGSNRYRTMAENEWPLIEEFAMSLDNDLAYLIKLRNNRLSLRAFVRMTFDPLLAPPSSIPPGYLEDTKTREVTIPYELPDAVVNLEEKMAVIVYEIYALTNDGGVHYGKCPRLERPNPTMDLKKFTTKERFDPEFEKLKKSKSTEFNYELRVMGVHIQTVLPQVPVKPDMTRKERDAYATKQKSVSTRVDLLLKHQRTLVFEMNRWYDVEYKPALQAYFEEKARVHKAKIEYRKQLDVVKHVKDLSSNVDVLLRGALLGYFRRTLPFEDHRVAKKPRFSGLHLPPPPDLLKMTPEVYQQMRNAKLETPGGVVVEYPGTLKGLAESSAGKMIPPALPGGDSPYADDELTPDDKQRFNSQRIGKQPIDWDGLSTPEENVWKLEKWEYLKRDLQTRKSLFLQRKTAEFKADMESKIQDRAAPLAAEDAAELAKRVLKIKEHFDGLRAKAVGHPDRITKLDAKEKKTINEETEAHNRLVRERNERESASVGDKVKTAAEKAFNERMAELDRRIKEASRIPVSVAAPYLFAPPGSKQGGAAVAATGDGKQGDTLNKLAAIAKALGDTNKASGVEAKKVDPLVEKVKQDKLKLEAKKIAAEAAKLQREAKDLPDELDLATLKREADMAKAKAEKAKADAESTNAEAIIQANRQKAEAAALLKTKEVGWKEDEAKNKANEAGRKAEADRDKAERERVKAENDKELALANLNRLNTAKDIAVVQAQQKLEQARETHALNLNKTGAALANANMLANDKVETEAKKRAELERLNDAKIAAMEKAQIQAKEKEAEKKKATIESTLAALTTKVNGDVESLKLKIPDKFKGTDGDTIMEKYLFVLERYVWDQSKIKTVIDKLCDKKFSQDVPNASKVHMQKLEQSVFVLQEFVNKCTTGTVVLDQQTGTKAVLSAVDKCVTAARDLSATRATLDRAIRRYNFELVRWYCELNLPESVVKDITIGEAVRSNAYKAKGEIDALILGLDQYEDTLVNDVKKKETSLPDKVGEILATPLVGRSRRTLDDFKDVPEFKTILDKVDELRVLKTVLKSYFEWQEKVIYYLPKVLEEAFEMGDLRQITAAKNVRTLFAHADKSKLKTRWKFAGDEARALNQSWFDFEPDSDTENLEWRLQKFVDKDVDKDVFNPVLIKKISDDFFYQKKYEFTGPDLPLFIRQPRLPALAEKLKQGALIDGKKLDDNGLQECYDNLMQWMKETVVTPVVDMADTALTRKTAEKFDNVDDLATLPPDAVSNEQSMLELGEKCFQSYKEHLNLFFNYQKNIGERFKRLADNFDRLIATTKTIMERQGAVDWSQVYNVVFESLLLLQVTHGMMEETIRMERDFSARMEQTADQFKILVDSGVGTQLKQMNEFFAKYPFSLGSLSYKLNDKVLTLVDKVHTNVINVLGGLPNEKFKAYLNDSLSPWFTRWTALLTAVRNTGARENELKAESQKLNLYLEDNTEVVDDQMVSGFGREFREALPPAGVELLTNTKIKDLENQLRTTVKRDAKSGEVSMDQIALMSQLSRARGSPNEYASLRSLVTKYEGVDNAVADAKTELFIKTVRSRLGVTFALPESQMLSFSRIYCYFKVFFRVQDEIFGDIVIPNTMCRTRYDKVMIDRAMSVLFGSNSRENEARLFHYRDASKKIQGYLQAENPGTAVAQSAVQDMEVNPGQGVTYEKQLEYYANFVWFAVNCRAKFNPGEPLLLNPFVPVEYNNQNSTAGWRNCTEHFTMDPELSSFRIANTGVELPPQFKSTLYSDFPLAMAAFENDPDYWKLPIEMFSLYFPSIIVLTEAAKCINRVYQNNKDKIPFVWSNECRDILKQGWRLGTGVPMPFEL